MGELDDTTDLTMENAIVESLTSGCINVIDTAQAYREERSEKVVSRALVRIMDEGIPRREIFLASKLGLALP
jgi:diketogulonate reductase-like aldo/keto reductase